MRADCRTPRLAVMLAELALLGELLLLVSCSSPRPEVSVQILTDLVPVTQFDEIVVRRDGVGRSFVASNGQRYDTPRLVVEYTDVAPGTLLELVAELRFRGTTVLRRSRTTRVTGRHIVLFTFSASCTEITCPMGDPRATECLGGRCVVPGCEGVGCVEPECRADGECPPSSSCEAPRCVDGVCFQFADPARCGPNQVCVPGRGCELRLPDPDGGMPSMPDAWLPAPIDAAGVCLEGAVVACTASCGTQGTARCEGGRLGPCEPPPEQCGGGDEDCDLVVDEGFECPAGTADTCVASCGSPGTRSCGADCRWSSCVPSGAERCNGADEDCDGVIDEGYRARYGFSTFSELATHFALCDGTTERHGLGCNAAIHRYCRDGCTTSGFGPIENDGDVANVGCVVGEVRDVSFGTLASFHALCDGTFQRFGAHCNAAIHRWCVTQGFSSGFGPVETDGDRATITCVRHAEVRMTTFTELSSFFGACDGMPERVSLGCNAAISRYCATQGFTTGFGPIENDWDLAYVACVRP
ncbi:MAG: hypothetical protein OHK0013_25580 [Sandaracinaceae bacterium]